MGSGDQLGLSSSLRPDKSPLLPSLPCAAEGRKPRGEEQKRGESKGSLAGGR